MHDSAVPLLNAAQLQVKESGHALPPRHGPGGDGVERWLSSLCVERIAAGPDMIRVTGREEGQCTEHWPRNNQHVVFFVDSGRCLGTVGHEHVVLGAGGVLWAHPGTPARLRVPERETSVVHRLRMTHDPSVDVFAESFLLADAVWEARTLLTQLARELRGGPYARLRDERVRGLLTVLFTSVLRAAASRDAPGLLSRAAQQIITELTDRRISERLRSADLADAVGLTPDYFTRVFRRTFGIPPREWLMRRRVRHGALALTTSNASINHIAQSLGYPDPFLFSRQFKLVMGVPPQTYRRRQVRDTPGDVWADPARQWSGAPTEGSGASSPRASRP
ncbi:AraC family transcriptional regulator [Streptomyces sp. NPDC048409]|uniref:helix-turn-helix domain-containing protein n=1 Tax=Streptomyces sp. NPDC048409 TaxID=3154723 RepID=UPI0034431388